DPIEVGSGDSSSDESGSDTGLESSSATTPTYVISPVFGSSNEGKMENTMIGGGGAEGPVAAVLNPHEYRDDRWLDIDHFPDGELEADHNSDRAGIREGQGTEDNGAEYKCQKTGYIEDKTGPGVAKDC
ncbi:MAG: hypothetical protein Q9217_006714, partial [Psora testacea]